MNTIDLKQPAQGPVWFSFRGTEGEVEPDPTFKHTLASLVLDFLCNPISRSDLPFDPTKMGFEEIGQHVLVQRIADTGNVPTYTINLVMPGFQEAVLASAPAPHAKQ